MTGLADLGCCTSVDPSDPERAISEYLLAVSCVKRPSDIYAHRVAHRRYCTRPVDVWSIQTPTSFRPLIHVSEYSARDWFDIELNAICVKHHFWGNTTSEGLTFTSFCDTPQLRMRLSPFLECRCIKAAVSTP